MSSPTTTKIGMMPDVSRSPQWHAVRPWSPRFLLTVREITSVSTTFVLSSTCARDGVDAQLASLAPGLDSDDEDALGDSVESIRLGMSKLSMVSDALGRGLSVSVNGAPWQKIIMDGRPDGNGDEEAILVIYGLMPGRQYDVEVGITFADGEEVLHSRMVTQPQAIQYGSEDSADTSMESTSSALPAVSNSSPPSGLTPINSQRPSITLEEYASQLRNQLTHLNQERDTLAAQLKSARKEAHKADAAKRNEIDALKRAAEKHAAVEVRGRQKMRALQEAAKQAAAAARDAEDSARELEASLPALRERESQLSARHATIAAEASHVQSEAEEALAADRLRTDALRSELNGLKTRLEKLQTKKTRLSGETLPKIEKQLEDLVREVELVVRDAGAFEVIDNGPVGFDLDRPVAGGQQYVLGQPPPVGRQGISSLSTSSSTSSDNSALSSRTLPFDPNGAHMRLAPAFQLQATGGAHSNARRMQQPHLLLQSHAQSQSVDNVIHIPVAKSGQSAASGSPTRESSSGAESRVANGPTRHLSLPLRMPSHVGSNTR